MMSFDHLLNRPAEEVAYSRSPAIVPSPPTPGPSSASPTRSSHKYSNSSASTTSFASSTTTNPFGSHSRKSSATTNPESPQTGIFPFSFHKTNNITNIDDGKSNATMADLPNPVDQVGQRSDSSPTATSTQPHSNTQPFAQLFANRAINLTDDDSRAESPTDAIMPLRRAIPGFETNSPQSLLASQAAPAERGDKVSASDMEPTTAPASAGAANPIFPAAAGYTAGNRAQFRLAPELISIVVPRWYATTDALFAEIDISAQRTCKWMEGLCDMTAHMDVADVPWRKAMSHIFGRNKNCTRSIPDHVWHWVCRKHYQRGRYRNCHDYYIKLTCFVELQVLRLEIWSNNNKDMGMRESGVVVDYTLAPRRREQMRQQQASRKRSSTEDSDSSDDDEQASEGATMPDWLQQACGAGKSALEIMQVLDRIIRDLESNNISRFPDVEILPNITGDRAKPKSRRAKARKAGARASASTPKALPHREKRRRSGDDNEATSSAPANAGNSTLAAQFANRPNHGGFANAPLPHDRYGYGNNFGAHENIFAPAHPDTARGHRSTRSWDAYVQPQLNFPHGPYAQQPNPYGAYNRPGGYQAAYPARDMRDNAYAAHNFPQNGYWNPDYDARQRQQQPAAYSQGGFYSSTTPTNTPLGGAPPAHVAKHTKSQSTPQHTVSMMMGGNRAHAGYGAEMMRSRPEPSGTYSAAHQNAATPATNVNVYGQPPSGYQTYTDLPAPTATTNPRDTVPRAAEYGTPSTPARLPPRASESTPDETYETYPGAVRR